MMESRRLKFHTGEHDTGQRLDVWLTERLKDVTRSYVQKLISEGYVHVDGAEAKAASGLKPNDRGYPGSSLYQTSRTGHSWTWFMGFINYGNIKGMVVHPVAGNWEDPGARS